MSRKRHVTRCSGEGVGACPTSTARLPRATPRLPRTRSPNGVAAPNATAPIPNADAGVPSTVTAARACRNCSPRPVTTHGRTHSRPPPPPTPTPPDRATARARPRHRRFRPVVRADLRVPGRPPNRVNRSRRPTVVTGSTVAVLRPVVVLLRLTALLRVGRPTRVRMLGPIAPPSLPFPLRPFPRRRRGAARGSRSHPVRRAPAHRNRRAPRRAPAPRHRRNRRATPRCAPRPPNRRGARSRRLPRPRPLHRGLRHLRGSRRVRRNRRTRGHARPVRHPTCGARRVSLPSPSRDGNRRVIHGRSARPLPVRLPPTGRPRRARIPRTLRDGAYRSTPARTHGRSRPPERPQRRGPHRRGPHRRGGPSLRRPRRRCRTTHRTGRVHSAGLLAGAGRSTRRRLLRTRPVLPALPVSPVFPFRPRQPALGEERWTSSPAGLSPGRGRRRVGHATTPNRPLRTGPGPTASLRAWPQAVPERAVPIRAGSRHLPSRHARVRNVRNPNVPSPNVPSRRVRSRSVQYPTDDARDRTANRNRRPCSVPSRPCWTVAWSPTSTVTSTSTIVASPPPAVPPPAARPRFTAPLLPVLGPPALDSTVMRPTVPGRLPVPSTPAGRTGQIGPPRRVRAERPRPGLPRHRLPPRHLPAHRLLDRHLPPRRPPALKAIRHPTAPMSASNPSSRQAPTSPAAPRRLRRGHAGRSLLAGNARKTGSR
ncbi:hypothetical protein LY12_005116 [Prauserella alba]|nr:hypothetical protein [Prauserella alba]